MTQDNEYREMRERKRDALIELGVDPYAVRTPEREAVKSVQEAFEIAEDEGGDGPIEVATYGIVASSPRRTQWGIYFDLADPDNPDVRLVQVGVRSYVLNLSASAQAIERIRPGQLVGFHGYLTYSGQGLPTLYVRKLLVWLRGPSDIPEHDDARAQALKRIAKRVRQLLEDKDQNHGIDKVLPPSIVASSSEEISKILGPVSATSSVKLQARAIAGRVLANRKMGKKAVFMDVYDGSGKLQVYLNKKGVGEQGMAVYENIDLGDFVWVKGDVQRTRTGEVTLFASELQFLAKSLSVPPLPREYKDEEGNTRKADALTDPELRHRKRYLDLMVHEEVRRRFENRSRVVSVIRRFLEDQGYLEVETPIMHPIPGGARARPFVTHHNALGMNLYLRIAPELYLKRLLVGGFERVFEINRSFRNEGVDHTHNPEFTMLELYEAYADYHRMMELTEGMIVAAARELRGDDLKFEWNGHEIDLTPPFKKATYADLFREHVGFDMHDEEKVEAAAKQLEVDPKAGYWTKVNEILEEHVEPKLIQPTFMIDYPTPICPLTKAKPDNSELAERFELFIGGMEFGNAFSELNEPVEQLRRFEEQVQEGEQTRDVEAPREIDYDYVEALEAGMPPAGGLGVGIDRLVMLLTGQESIREVILFPHMRREHVHQKDAAIQRARIAIESVLEELESPELRDIEGFHQLNEKFSRLVEDARNLLESDG